MLYWLPTSLNYVAEIVHLISCFLIDADGNYYAYAFSSDSAGLSSELRGIDPLMQLIYQDRPHRRSRIRSRRWVICNRYSDSYSLGQSCFLLLAMSAKPGNREEPLSSFKSFHCIACGTCKMYSQKRLF